MTFPVGVITRPVTFGPAVSIVHGSPMTMQVTFRPVRSGVHQATGTPMVNVVQASSTAPGVAASIDLPVTDQVAYLDGAGNLIDLAGYNVTINYILDRRAVSSASGLYALPAGDGSPMDLDAFIPITSAAGVTVLIPDIWTVNIATETAARIAAIAATNATVAAHSANTANPHAVTKTQVGLGNVDNTADTAKPVSTTQQGALDLKAPLASPAFTGTPTGITKTHVGLANVDNTSDVSKPVSTATTTAISTAINNLINGSPGALDTLKELADAMGDDPNFATTLTNALALKAPLASPTFTGTVSGVTKTHVGLANVDNTSDVNKPVSTAGAAADALKVDLTTLAKPSYAGTRANPYDAMRNVYNWKSTNTRKLRAALGRARAASGTANIMFYGDSATEGKLTTSSFNRAKSWPLAFRDTLESLGVPVSGDGMVVGGNGTGSTPYDPRVTFTGTWTQSLGYANSTDAAGVATWTFTKPCTSIDIWSSGVSGAFQVRLDGVLQTTVNPNASSSWVKTTITGTLGTHVVTLTKTNTTATGIKALNAYGASGVLVHNMGISGWSANDGITYTLWYQGEGSIEQVLPKAGLAAAFFCIGANDMVVLGRTAAQAKADLATLIARWQTGPDIVLVAEEMNNTLTQAGWEAYVTLLYDLADTLDCPLIDTYGRIGNYTTANANGIYTDGAHLTVGGYSDWGRNAGLIAAS